VPRRPGGDPSYRPSRFPSPIEAPRRGGGWPRPVLLISLAGLTVGGWPSSYRRCASPASSASPIPGPLRPIPADLFPVTPAPFRHPRAGGVQGPTPTTRGKAGLDSRLRGNDKRGKRHSRAPFRHPRSLSVTPALLPVTPAKAGVQGPTPQRAEGPAWIDAARPPCEPAFAGMTEEGSIAASPCALSDRRRGNPTRGNLRKFRVHSPGCDNGRPGQAGVLRCRSCGTGRSDGRRRARPAGLPPSRRHRPFGRPAGGWRSPRFPSAGLPVSTAAVLASSSPRSRPPHHRLAVGVGAGPLMAPFAGVFWCPLAFRRRRSGHGRRPRPPPA